MSHKARQISLTVGLAVVILTGGCGPAMMFTADPLHEMAAARGSVLLQQTFTTTPFTANFTTLAADEAVSLTVRGSDATSRPDVSVTDVNGAVVVEQTAGTSFVNVSFTPSVPAAYTVTVTETATASSTYTISVVELRTVDAGYPGVGPMMFGFGPMMFGAGPMMGL